MSNPVPLPSPEILAAVQARQAELAAERAKLPPFPPRATGPTPGERLAADIAEAEERRRAAEAAAQLEREKAAQARQEAHAAACITAGLDPQLGPEDAAQARLYARGRAFKMLPAAFDLVERALCDPSLTNQAKTALAMIERACGKPTAPNAVSTDLTALPPSQAVEHVMQQIASGKIDPAFGQALIDTLRQRAKAQQVDAIVKGAANG